MSDTTADLNFGDYCEIEQKRHGVPNEFYQYKVIHRGIANYYRPVPVDANGDRKVWGEMTEVVKAICCGVIEEKVETFRLEDVLPCTRYQASPPEPDLTVRLIPEHAQARTLTALQWVYRKHVCNDDGIGWQELEERIVNALCEAMGDEEFQNWLEQW